MKSMLVTLTLITTLAGLAGPPARAQSADDLRAEPRAKEIADLARRDSDSAKLKADIAKIQAEVARNGATIESQRELVEEDRQLTGQIREAATAAMGKAQKEAQRAMEKARIASQKALGEVDLAQVEVEVQRALAAADVAVQKGFRAQAAVPALPAPPAPPAPAKVSVRPNVNLNYNTRRPSVRTLVVAANPGDAKAIASLEEDLTVMWRILDKETERELGKDGADKAMGIFISSSDSRGPSATYLDGYGALFTLSARFPLVAPPKAKEEPKGETASDSTWEKTRRELFGSPDFGGSGKESKLKYFRGEHSPEAEYDAAKVEALKNGLLDVLKNASNLRQLKPDDVICVAVLGGGYGGSGDMFIYKTDTSSKGRSSYSVTTTASASAGGQTTVTSSEPFDPAAKDIMFGKFDGGRNSTLTIKVKKSDVDSFAKGKLSLDEFRQKAAINIY